MQGGEKPSVRARHGTLSQPHTHTHTHSFSCSLSHTHIHTDTHFLPPTATDLTIHYPGGREAVSARAPRNVPHPRGEEGCHLRRVNPKPHTSNPTHKTSALRWVPSITPTPYLKRLNPIPCTPNSTPQASPWGRRLSSSAGTLELLFFFFITLEPRVE